MNSMIPAPGDFVVEYRGSWQNRGGARVVVVQVTADAGPEEVFSSCLVESGRRAERLAATWALEDGAAAWSVVRTDTGERRFTRLDTDVRAAPGIVCLGLLQRNLDEENAAHQALPAPPTGGLRAAAAPAEPS